jgi:exodeoxyribonuclease VII large subunit
VDDLLGRAQTAAATRLQRSRDHARRLRERLLAFRPDRQIEAQRSRLQTSQQRLRAGFARQLLAGRSALGALSGKLSALSPLSVLGRGYALVWDAAEERLLRRADDAAVGDSLRIRLQEGALRATVTAKEPAP